MQEKPFGSHLKPRFAPVGSERWDYIAAYHAAMPEFNGSRDLDQAIREDSTRRISKVTAGLLSKLTAVVTGVALLDFVSYLIATSYLGGDAVNGKIEGSRYYLWGPYQGTKTYHEVSHAVFTFSRLHTRLFILWPLMFVLIFVSKRVARRNEF